MPVTPNNSRSRGMEVNEDKHAITPGRITDAIANMSKREAEEMLKVGDDYSEREVKLKHSMLARKYYPDK